MKRNVTEREAVYNIAGMPYIYNLDFVAGKEDGLRLVANDGYYRTDLTMENGKFYVWTTLDDATDPYQTCVADVPDSAGDSYYRVETTAGMSRLYANGRWIASFRSVRATGGSSLAVNVIKGDGMKYLAVSDNNDIFLYADDFRGSGEFATMDHWHKRNQVSCFVDQDNGTMTVDALDRKDAIVELDAFAGNAVLSADVDIKECTGGFWFILNHNVTNVYTKIGYNFQTGKFEAVNRNENSYVTTDTAEGELPIGKTVRMELKIQELKAGKQAVLYVDGRPVLTQNPSYYHRGKLGFIADEAFVYLRSVSYRGDTKPALGVSETIHPGNNCSFDLIETDEKLLLTGYSKRYSSTDNGKTWTEEKLREMDSFNTVRLQSGDVLTMRRRVMGKDEKTGANLLTNFFAVSKDDGETWQELSMLTPEVKTNVGDKNNSMRQGPSGRIYVITMESSNEDYGYNRVWYSDDDGLNWTEGKTPLDAKALGFTIAECTIMELQSGVARCYFRSNTGYISYIDSYDRGDTWETTPHTTPFLSPANMFNIDYDPVDKGTLYMAWGYDNAGIDARVQFNRSRWAVAKSTDDGETWEFLGTYHENNYLNSTWFMNLNINVARDCFILECYSMDNLSFGYSSRKLTVEKSKQKPVKKFERLHMVYEDQIRQTEMVPEVKRDRVMVVHPETGAVLMQGEISNHAAYEGYIAVDYAAAFVGAVVKAGSDGGLLLQTGDRTEAFEPGALSARDCRWFIKTDVFAEKFGLTAAEQDGIQIISPYRQWSRGQVRAFRYAVDLFATEV